MFAELATLLGRTFAEIYDLLKVAILGATGLAGQWLVSLLSDHPWFEIEVLAASARSAGRRYSECVRWRPPRPLPQDVGEMAVELAGVRAAEGADLVFSSLPSNVARGLEPELAKRGFLVVSDASAHRMDEYVPLMNPEVNAEHIELLELQRKAYGWDGAVVTTPNCTAAVLTLSLKPIFDEHGLEQVIVSTMQAISGAGYPGPASIDLVDNIIPFIADEEEKVEAETLKILGEAEKAASFAISTSCHRVPVLDGHLEAVFVKTSKEADPDSVAKCMEDFRGEPQRLELPSAPEKPIIVRREVDRPQPRFDRLAGGGMSVVVGRIRRDPALGGVKYLVLGHNLVRGAAGCAVLTAELLRARKYV